MSEKNLELPQAVEMEKSVLGAMMLKQGLVIPKIRSMLKEDDFYRAEHRMVYRVLLELYDVGIEPNILSLSEELRKKQELEKIGLRYVFMLGESTSSSRESDKRKGNLETANVTRRDFTRRSIERFETIARNHE